MIQKRMFLTAALSVLLALTGCGGSKTASRTAGAPLPGSTVSQILEESAAGGTYGAVPDTPSAGEGEEAAAPEYAVLVPEETESVGLADSAHDGIDVDLTRLSSTMIYGQVADMMYMPEDYVGKTIRVRGQAFSAYYEETDTTYYSVMIADATACCAQGLEYVLTDADYPADDAEVTVTGVFEIYDEMGITYCRLTDAGIAL